MFALTVSQEAERPTHHKHILFCMSWYYI